MNPLFTLDFTTPADSVEGLRWKNSVLPKFCGFYVLSCEVLPESGGVGQGQHHHHHNNNNNNNKKKKKNKKTITP